VPLGLRLLRGVDPTNEGERGVMRAIADGDARGVHDGLSCLSYLPDPGAFDPDALLENLATRRRMAARAGLARLGPSGRRSHRRAGLSAALAVVRADSAE
jgi:hypothetical protein